MTDSKACMDPNDPPVGVRIENSELRRLIHTFIGWDETASLEEVQDWAQGRLAAIEREAAAIASTSGEQRG